MGAPSKSKLSAVPASISSVLESCPVLPGESAAVYRQALAQTLQELNATPPLQIYLAEKIFECLWWMRRYEQQKRHTLIKSMCGLLEPQGYISDMNSRVLRNFHDLEVDTQTPELIKALAAKSHTLESLRQAAFDKCRDRILQLDELIALKAKTLSGFQGSLEALVNRKLNTERLQLQNSLMRRDLQAIEIDKPKTSTGQ